MDPEAVFSEDGDKSLGSITRDLLEQKHHQLEEESVL
jgi:hypothetical protein